MSIVETKTRVLYADTDKMGVVYYGNYLTFFEMGRTEYLRAKGLTYSELEEKGYLLPVTEVRCQYLSSAYYDEEIIIRTAVSSMSKVRIHFIHELVAVKDGRVLVRGEVHLASVDTNVKPKRLPKEMFDIVEINPDAFKK